MTPTKYPSEPSLSPLALLFGVGRCLVCRWEGRLRPLWGATRKRGPHGGREAPLDLIEEHLTYGDTESPYRQGVQGGELLKNWFFPRGWNGTKEGKET